MKSGTKLTIFLSLLIVLSVVLGMILAFKTGPWRSPGEASDETISVETGIANLAYITGNAADEAKAEFDASIEPEVPDGPEKLELHGQTEEGRNRGIAVLMYHYVYDPSDPPYPLNDNYISTTALAEQLEYLTSEGYKFPSWEDVRKYVDGEVDLPKKSVVLTFDDGSKGFMKYGVPLLEEYNVPATAFIIAGKNGEKWAEFAEEHPLIDLESHSFDMHTPGGVIGHGGIMTALPKESIIEDLNKSSEILGNGKAFAYPFGDYDEAGTCRSAVEEAGFLLGFTTVYGKVFPDADPYLLPRIRVLGSNSLETFKGII